MKTILVPIDFSKQAEIAIDFASQIALKTGAILKLIHVYEYPVATSFSTMDVGGIDPVEGELAREMMEECREKLEKSAKECIELGITVDSEIKMGNPFTGLSEELKNEKVDLIVMGTHGTESFEDTLIGSNTEKVVRHAPCPVIAVKTPPKLKDIKSILFASDFKEDGTDFVKKLKELQVMLGATIHFVRINTLNNFEPDHFSEKRMLDWISVNKFENYTSRIYNDLKEEDGIFHYADEMQVSMLAIGTHGRSGISQLFKGSIAEEIVNHAKRPIWTYRLK